MNRLVLCKKNFFIFKKGDYYKIKGIHSIFEEDDFITIESKETNSSGNYILCRFILKDNVRSISDYIGENEINFHDIFIDIYKERNDKLSKLDNIANC